MDQEQWKGIAYMGKLREELAAAKMGLLEAQKAAEESAREKAVLQMEIGRLQGHNDWLQKQLHDARTALDVAEEIEEDRAWQAYDPFPPTLKPQDVALGALLAFGLARLLVQLGKGRKP